MKIFFRILGWLLVTSSIPITAARMTGDPLVVLGALWLSVILAAVLFGFGIRALVRERDVRARLNTAQALVVELTNECQTGTRGALETWTLPVQKACAAEVDRYESARFRLQDIERLEEDVKTDLAKTLIPQLLAFMPVLAIWYYDRAVAAGTFRAPTTDTVWQSAVLTIKLLGATGPMLFHIGGIILLCLYVRKRNFEPTV